jgi:hypothetical protein
MYVVTRSGILGTSSSLNEYNRGIGAEHKPMRGHLTGKTNSNKGSELPSFEHICY